MSADNLDILAEDFSELEGVAEADSDGREPLLRILSWAASQSYQRDPVGVVQDLRTMLDGWMLSCDLEASCN